MPREKRNYKLIKEQAHSMWRDGEKDLSVIASMYRVSPRTIEKWRREDNWVDAEVTEAQLKQKLDKVMMEASIKAFEDYTENPTDKEKQSLVFLIKHFQKQLSPAKELNNYILMFCEQVVDYFIQQGMDQERELFQANLHGLAEYLRTRNNG
jgi:hypothetical protein